MIEVRKVANVWMVVRVNSQNEVVSVIRSFRQQAAACRCLMRLYAEGAL